MNTIPYKSKVDFLPPVENNRFKNTNSLANTMAPAM